MHSLSTGTNLHMHVCVCVCTPLPVHDYQAMILVSISRGHLQGNAAGYCAGLVTEIAYDYTLVVSLIV